MDTCLTGIQEEPGESVQSGYCGFRCYERRKSRGIAEAERRDRDEVCPACPSIICSWNLTDRRWKQAAGRLIDGSMIFKVITLNTNVRNTIRCDKLLVIKARA